MPQPHNRKRDVDKVVAIVRDAGGKLVGRTRLQKIGYLLERSGLGEGFPFEYRHYGPYSEELASATRNAGLFGLLDEQEYPTSWGGLYSVFTTPAASSPDSADQSRIDLIREGADANPIELELAATAAFFADQGSADPWQETAKRKPQKAEGGRLDNAKVLYRRLQQIETPKPLPRIA